MAFTPWPFSLRSPLWGPLFGLVAGMALSWHLPALPGSAFAFAIALALAPLLVWRAPRFAAGWMALCGGYLLMESAAASSREPDWRGAGCFTCRWAEAAVQERFGWRVVAQCRGAGTTRTVRLEGRGTAPDCVGRATVWARWVTWERRGDFDEAAVYRKRGIAGRLAVFSELDWQVAEEPRDDWFEAWSVKLRRRLRARYEAHLSRPAVAFLWGISTGDKSLLTPAHRSDFARVGLAHVLAVSGYHVGLIGFLPLLLARSKRQSMRLLALAGIPLIGGYVHFCGGSDSALRAWGMASLLLVGAAVRRPIPLAHSWCTMGWVMALFHPLSVLQLGTQLSFVAVLGIALGLAALAQWPHARWGSAVAVPVAAQAATAPLAVPTFGQFPTAFLPVNLVAGPWVTAIGFSALAWLVWPSTWPGFSTLSAWLDACARWFMLVVERIAPWDGISLAVDAGDHVRWWAVGAGVMAVFIALIRPHHPGWGWAAVALLMSWPWWPAPTVPHRDWEVLRGRYAHLRLGEQWVYTDSLRSSGSGITTEVSHQGLLAYQHVSDSLQIWGVNRQGTWAFRTHERAGMGRLEIGGHRWVWERWQPPVRGRWPP